MEFYFLQRFRKLAPISRPGLTVILGLLFCFTITSSPYAQQTNPLFPSSAGALNYNQRQTIPFSNPFTPTPKPGQSRGYPQQVAPFSTATTLPKGDFLLDIKLSFTPGDTYADLSWQYTQEPDMLQVDERLLTHASPAKKAPSVEDVAGFVLVYGNESGNYYGKVDLGKVSKYRVRGLQNHQTYFFAIKAYDKSKLFSNHSNEISVTPKPADELLSNIERLISGDISPKISTELKQFGYEIFRTSVPGFAPVTDVPVGPNYIIGPGDSFTVTIWGKAEAVFPVQVTRDGLIILPKVGAIKVWGLTFVQLQEVVVAGLRKYYPDFKINITMNKLKTIRVFVVGETVNPGSYSLSSLSTMINALFACGGPTKNGSLRRVQLIRNGKTVNTLDLYDFLLKGDKSQDARIEAGDTIFIPVIGKVVGMAGNVKRPAIYEMKNTMTVGQLIDLTGGVTPTGYLQRVQIERVDAHEKKIVLDLNLSSGKNSPKFNTSLQDGDVVKIYSIAPLADEPMLPLTKNIVHLEGHVMHPDGYELKPGMTLSDLITSFNDLLPEPHLDYAEIIRLEEPDFHERIIPFNLGKVLAKEPKHDLKLQQFDRVKIYSKSDFKEKYTVSIVGQVRRPDTFLLFDNMRIKDLIETAGGFNDRAYLQNAELTRMIIKQEGIQTKRVEINLAKAMAQDESHNILLQKFDSLKVRIIPEWRAVWSVTIEGKVKFPGQYTIKKGEPLNSVLKRAGGYTDDAYLRGAIFTRASVRKKQRQRLGELAKRQEQEIQAASALIMGGSLNKEDLAATQQSLAVQKDLLKKLSAAKVTGRVVVHLAPLTEFAESEYNLILEDGDKLTVPLKPSTVDVLGAVYNPTAILHRKHKPTSYYLEKVGGPTKNAEQDEIYLILADGSIISRSQASGWGIHWDSDTNSWVAGSKFMTTKLEPGDTILVPRKLEKIQWLKTSTQFTQILYQIAIAAGVTIALF